MTRETYRLVENIHPLYIINYILRPCIQLPIIPTHSLSFFYASAYYSTSLSYISLFLFLFHHKFTNSNSPNLLHMCLHLDYHLDLHPISMKHALPISDSKFPSNTTLNIHFTIAFASLSSKLLHHVSPMIS